MLGSAIRIMVKLICVKFSKNSNAYHHNPPTSQTDRRMVGRTDRQTDRQHTMTIPRYAYRATLRYASRGKKYNTKQLKYTTVEVVFGHVIEENHTVCMISSR